MWSCSVHCELVATTLLKQVYTAYNYCKHFDSLVVTGISLSFRPEYSGSDETLDSEDSQLSIVILGSEGLSQNLEKVTREGYNFPYRHSTFASLRLS